MAASPSEDIRRKPVHGSALRGLLRPAGSPADHFRDKVLETCRGNSMMSLVYLRVRIQAGIDHDAIDEAIYHEVML